MHALDCRQNASSDTGCVFARVRETTVYTGVATYFGDTNLIPQSGLLASALWVNMYELLPALLCQGDRSSYDCRTGIDPAVPSRVETHTRGLREDRSRSAAC